MNGMTEERLAEIEARQALVITRAPIDDITAWATANSTLATVDVPALILAYRMLRGLLGSHADGHRCSCTLLDSGGIHEPPEWEQDPWCITHPDMDYVTAEVARLRAQVPPQVGSVEELEGLPLGSIVLGKQGTAWQFKRRGTVGVQHLSEWECDGVATSAASLLQTHGALTVVWRP